MLSCLAGFFAAVAAVNWIVNPYGAWPSTLVDPAYRVTKGPRNEAQERVSIAYRIRAERPATLLVGSSRVVWGMQLEHGAQDGFFNASMSGASLEEIAAILRLATANPRLERVIWGVDFYAFDERFAGFRHPETRVRLEGDERRVMALRIKEMLFSMRALDESGKVLLQVAAGRKKQPLSARVPWPEEVIRAELQAPGRRGLDRADEAALRAQLRDWVGNYSTYRPSGPLLAVYRDAIAGLTAAGIAVTVFVPPLSGCELEVIEQAGRWDTLQEWKRQLLVAGPYWDFSGYGKLERADWLFLDVAHFWPAVGHAMLRQFLGEGCRECGDAGPLLREAGVWVDTSSIDAYLDQQEARRAAGRHRAGRCAKVVEEMLRAEARAARAPAAGADPGLPHR
jgi:hypothetical protein